MRLCTFFVKNMSCFLSFSMQIHTYTSTPFVFKNSESESSTNLQTYFTKWEEKDLNEFTRLVEKYEKT